MLCLETSAQLERPIASRPFSEIAWPCFNNKEAPARRIIFAKAFTSPFLLLKMKKARRLKLPKENLSYSCKLHLTTDYHLMGGSPAQVTVKQLIRQIDHVSQHLHLRICEKPGQFHVKWLPKISSEPFRSDPVWTTANAKATKDLFYQTVDVQFVLFHEVWSIFLQHLP